MKNAIKRMDVKLPDNNVFMSNDGNVERELWWWWHGSQQEAAKANAAMMEALEGDGLADGKLHRQGSMCSCGVQVLYFNKYPEYSPVGTVQDEKGRGL